MSKITSKTQPENARFFLLGVSIGNSKDFPPRTLEIAKTCDLLVVEEDRPARQLLKAAKTTRDYYKFTEHHEKDTLDSVREALKSGQCVAYSSDQGMPNISDPGWQLTELALQMGADVNVIPGPSSISAALAACPFHVDQFFFAGFPPRKDSQRIRFLNNLIAMPYPVIIMETPYRRDALLTALANISPTKRKALLAFDISQESEEYIFANLSDLAAKAQKLAPKKPFVLVLAPLKKVTNKKS